MTKKKRNAQTKTLVYKTPQSKIDMPSYVSSLVNPFDPHAKGSKIHDANSSYTFPFQSREIKSLKVNNSGAAALQLFPFLNTNMVSSNSATTDIGAGGTVSATPTFVYTNVPEYTSITDVADQFRIVSWGFRMTCDDSATDAKGRVYIIEQTENVMNANQDLTLLSDNYMLLPVTHDMDYTVIPNHNNVVYQDFLDVASSYTSYASATEAAMPWRSVMVLLLGTNNSSTTVNFEIVYNLEFLPKIGTLGSRLSTPGAPHSHEILERVHNTRSAAPLVHPTKTLWQKMKSFAQKSLLSVGDYALDRLTGGLSHYVENAAKKFLPRPGQLFLTNG